MRTLILASGSPRRKEILTQMRLPFTVQTAEADESLPKGISPAEAGRLLATRKAMTVKERMRTDGTWKSDTLLLAADTLVWEGGVPLGKPRDESDALRMLLSLSGRMHTVCTGVCLLSGENVFAESDEAAVEFCPLTEKEARAYVRTGEPLDKAGAYAVQGLGAAFIRRIDGDFFTVMGLSPRVVRTLLQKAGVAYLEEQ